MRQALRDAASAAQANRLLFEWLTDDEQRRRLYDELRGQPVLKFESIEEPGGRSVYLLAGRQDIETAFKHLSVAPYAALGGGRFMLALDDGPAHTAQRDFAARALAYPPEQIRDGAETAYRRAAVLPLKSRQFNLPDLAEAAALRFVELLFGIPDQDHVLLLRTMRRAYLELCFRIIGRHFLAELEPRPPLPPGVKDLRTRIGELIGVPYHDQDNPLKGDTVIDRIARDPGGRDRDELVLILLGLLSGTVGNVQAAVSIAISDFFGSAVGPPVIDRAQRAAREDRDDELERLVRDALRRNPPAAFLPRQADGERLRHEGQPIPKGADLILAIGAADADQLVFGGLAADRSFVHQCVGEHLARPLVLHIVKQVLRLPGLAQVIDPADGRPLALKKRLGMICERYPLQYERARRLNMQPLNVIMKIKSPVKENAEKLRLLIGTGAPRIEAALDKSRHVHVAWFMLIDNDSKLALHTVYDGDFDAYIEHFALEVELFDKLFEFIEDAPPAPVREHPKEFVETIRRYNAAPFGGYFYSAYPTVTVADVRNRITGASQ